jgi:hypothetical protein
MSYVPADGANIATVTLTRDGVSEVIQLMALADPISALAQSVTAPGTSGTAAAAIQGVAGGAYYNTESGPGGYGMTESEEPWWAYGGDTYTSPFAALASQGWSYDTITNVHGSGRNGKRWKTTNTDGSGYWTPSGVSTSDFHWIKDCSSTPANCVP